MYRKMCLNCSNNPEALSDKLELEEITINSDKSSCEICKALLAFHINVEMDALDDLSSLLGSRQMVVSQILRPSKANH